MCGTYDGRSGSISLYLALVRGALLLYSIPGTRPAAHHTDIRSAHTIPTRNSWKLVYDPSAPSSPLTFEDNDKPRWFTTSLRHSVIRAAAAVLDGSGPTTGITRLRDSFNPTKKVAKKPTKKVSKKVSKKPTRRPTTKKAAKRTTRRR